MKAFAEDFKTDDLDIETEWERDDTSNITLSNYIEEGNDVLAISQNKGMDYFLVMQDVISGCASQSIIRNMRESVRDNNTKELSKYIEVIPFQYLSKDAIDKVYGILVNECSNNDTLATILDKMAEGIWNASATLFQPNKYIECLSSRYVALGKSIFVWKPAVVEIYRDGELVNLRHNFDELLITLCYYDEIKYQTPYILSRIEIIRKYYYPDYNFNEPYDYVKRNYNALYKYEPSVTPINYIIDGYRKANIVEDPPVWIKGPIPLGAKIRSVLGPNNPYSAEIGSFMLDGDDWFPGYCEYCNRTIKRKEYSVRSPLFGGGWFRTFCCWKHCRKYLTLQNDEIGIELSRTFEEQLNDSGLYIDQK